MRKFIFGIITSLIVCCVALGDVQIDKKHRVPNRQPGYCAWACLETLGRNQNVPSMENLVENRTKDEDYIEITLTLIGHNTYREDRRVFAKNLGAVGAIRQKLDLLKVKHKITTWDRTHMQEAVKNNGCVVWMRKSSLWNGEHAIILTDINDKTFRFIDPNGCDSWEGSREWFDRYWDGVVITIEMK